MKCEMLANSLNRQLPGVVHCTHNAHHIATVLTGTTRPRLKVCSAHAMQVCESPNYHVVWNQLDT